jgi:hypothetical protein
MAHRFYSLPCEMNVKRSLKPTAEKTKNQRKTSKPTTTNHTSGRITRRVETVRLAPRITTHRATHRISRRAEMQSISASPLERVCEARISRRVEISRRVRERREGGELTGISRVETVNGVGRVKCLTWPSLWGGFVAGADSAMVRLAGSGEGGLAGDSHLVVLG